MKKMINIFLLLLLQIAFTSCSGGGSDSGSSSSGNADQGANISAGDISFVSHEVITKTETRTVTDYSHYVEECTYTYDQFGNQTPHCTREYDTTTETYTVDVDVYKYTINQASTDHPPLLYKWYTSDDTIIMEGKESSEVTVTHEVGAEPTISVSVYDGTGNCKCRTYNSSDNTTSDCNDSNTPSVPTDVTAIRSGGNQLGLFWTASTDENGVIGYRIYRDGVLISFSPVVTFTDTGLNYETQYCYTVSALDVAGNESAKSSQTDLSCGLTR